MWGCADQEEIPEESSPIFKTRKQFWMLPIIERLIIRSAIAFRCYGLRFSPLFTIIAPFYNIFFFLFSKIDESLVEIMDNCLKRQIFWKFIVKGDTNLFLYPRKPPAQTIRGFIAVIVRRLVFDWSQEERKKKTTKAVSSSFWRKTKKLFFSEIGGHLKTSFWSVSNVRLFLEYLLRLSHPSLLWLFLKTRLQNTVNSSSSFILSCWLECEERNPTA